MRMKAEQERGSALALVPAGFLVLIILAAIAVDSAASYLGQQQLHDAVTAAANDAAAAALSNSSFYGSGAIAIDPGTASSLVCQSVQAQSFSDVHDVRLFLAVQGPAIRVEATATVNAVFGRALPGVGRRSVRAIADAVATSGPGDGPATPSTEPALATPTALDCG
jgi:Putative Tad-like Flp pilus-assembly